MGGDAHCRSLSGLRSFLCRRATSAATGVWLFGLLIKCMHSDTGGSSPSLPSHSAHMGDTAPMDFLVGISDDESAAPQAAPGASPQLAMVEEWAGAASDSQRRRRRVATSCGRGRHGGPLEKAALAAKMRECKARRRSTRLKGEVSSNVVRALESRKLVRGTIGKVKLRMASLGRQAGIRLALRDFDKLKRHSGWMSDEDILSLAYGEDNMKRAGDLASIFKISTAWVRKLQTLACDSYLHYQQHVMGRILALCMKSPSQFAVSRHCRDETGERLTMHAPGQSIASTVVVGLGLGCRLQAASSAIKSGGFGVDLSDWQERSTTHGCRPKI